MDKRPNIILLMADQMRGDCLGIAGHPDVKTPFLDALAADGVRYENAYSACPTCVPARASLYTGMSQEHTGRIGYEDLVPWNYTHTLAGELSKAGYYTQCVGKMHVHPLRNNLGFNDVRLHDGYLHAYRRPTTPSYEDQRVADAHYWWLKQQLGVDADPVDTGLDCNSWVVRPWIYEEKYHPTIWVASVCRDFLRRRDRSKPFFLMASFGRPQPPLDAPEYYLNLYKDKSLAEPWRGDWNDCVRWERDGHSYHAQTAPSDESYIQQLRAGYYAAITHMDHQIGRLVSALVEEQIMDNTIIRFVSDHGEMLVDHLMFQKAKPFQGSIHVPLFISGPERYVGKHGTVRTDLAELRDVMPTLLELAGTPIPETVDGTSLLHPVEREYLHGEHTLGADSMHFILTNEDKYIWYSQTGRELSFDLRNDPHENQNVLDEHQARVAELSELQITALKTRDEGEHDRAIVRDMAGKKGPKVLAFNKIDLLPPEKLLGLIASFADLGYDAIIPISAKTGDGRDDLTKQLATHLPEGPKYFPDDMITDQPERLICAELIREKALQHLRDEVPHGIGVEMKGLETMKDNFMEITATNS